MARPKKKEAVEETIVNDVAVPSQDQLKEDQLQDNQLQEGQTQEEDNEPIAPTNEENEEVDNTIAEDKNPDVKPESDVDTNPKKEESDIPLHILAILKVFKNYEELYISSKGGIYTSPYDNAKLYKNPYFK